MHAFRRHGYKPFHSDLVKSTFESCTIRGAVAVVGEPDQNCETFLREHVNLRSILDTEYT